MSFTRLLFHPLGLSVSLILGCSLAPLSLANNTSTQQAVAPPGIALASSHIPTKPDQYTVQRKKYAAAQKALSAKNTTEFHRLSEQLAGYPLLTYLEYEELVPRLVNLPYKDVERFFARYPDSFLAERLTHRWLRTLAQRQQWQDYRRFYDARLSDPELACLNLRARLETKDTSALVEADSLWNIEKTQSKACDPVFEQWKKAGRMTPELIWSRHLKVVRAGDVGMAGYLARQLPAAKQPLALQLQQVNANPGLIKQTTRFSQQTPEMKSIILLGLEKYARQDASDALRLWQHYDAQQLFEDADRLHIKHQIALRLLHQKKDREAELLVASSPDLSRLDLVEWLIRESLRRQDWEKVNEWLTRLPDDARQTERWRYWRARTMEELKILEHNGETPTAIYASLAPQRSFYGFLSADKTGIDYHLLDRPVTFTPEQLTKVENHPGIQRAREFYLMGNMSAASREWFYSTRRLPAQDIAIAGRLAKSWGWYRQGIQAMVDGNYWDDLEVRFPVLYQDHVAKAAKKTSVNPLLILAVTRQESAFMHDAKSPAGAVGLMQLLPSTAKQTAQRNGLSFHQQDLLTPEKNIALGSHYLEQLLKTYDGNRILAAAAYNAGPGRVRQWLNKEKDSQLPYDVWIETIPFRETRGYVQNVLSFSVIYAYRLGQKQNFITPEEANTQL
ncbi:transglycosylase SLT domain-containing protein [Cellvibrio japonicus]|uniref:Lytic murein transglycosylase, putative, lmt23A n=1 Tax=Cellvibrio japonicus (strain Ueda107) TaxID=498211 RepID=B3PHL6_CELJU|nr:transglycosylase SLT domain-containing protein [Cellvibrio japonicus]ACE82722.1 lytic murein transglycosylase, putative, lmt23A [Cellvibrio japonicus Ueda107]QEI12489.1 transglycosylase SLT domain-containing protein [Cellvibrio japonicus]QEI16063.1 transglycosylase SLT domain-containing protein [Cellvibrio japonicus]QEI19641.1 transglycosylase SLT domain-containing protein [Cellvibrio japonicus]